MDTNTPEVRQLFKERQKTAGGRMSSTEKNGTVIPFESGRIDFM